MPLKGVYNIRSNLSKYDTTWNPKIPLDLYTSLTNNYLLDLEKLSKKLITLLAIVTAHRMQTFSLIEVNNRNYSREKDYCPNSILQKLKLP